MNNDIIDAALRKHVQYMAAYFLREYSERLGNDGCNDMRLANTPANVELIKRVVDAHNAKHPRDIINFTPPTSEKKNFYAPLGNIGLVDYVANQLEKSK